MRYSVPYATLPHMKQRQIRVDEGTYWALQALAVSRRERVGDTVAALVAGGRVEAPEQTVPSGVEAFKRWPAPNGAALAKSLGLSTARELTVEPEDA